MGNYFIKNDKDPPTTPKYSNYSATVNFVNSKIKQVEDLNIKAAKQESVFFYYG